MKSDMRKILQNSNRWLEKSAGQKISSFLRLLAKKSFFSAISQSSVLGRPAASHFFNHQSFISGFFCNVNSFGNRGKI
jgi:hypothetical protein